MSLDKITPLAWVAIAAILIIMVAINLFMVSMLRDRSKMDEMGRRMRARGPSRTTRNIQDIREVVRDPFQAERKQLDALAREVARIPKANDSLDEQSSSNKTDFIV